MLHFFVFFLYLQIFVCFCILIANIYCLLCFVNVKELRAIEFGLIFVQTLTDITGTLFYAIVVIENYVSRYLFYCMPEQIQLSCRIENLTIFLFRTKLMRQVFSQFFPSVLVTTWIFFNQFFCSRSQLGQLLLRNLSYSFVTILIASNRR